MNVDFLDTNIFIYLFDRRDARKRAKAEGLVLQALQSDTTVISHQVVQETLNVLTSKIKPAVSAADAALFMDTTLVPLWRVMPTPQIYKRAIDIHTHYGFHFYDSLIVAAALDAGCTRLLTEDLQHGQRIGTLIVENPFL